MLEVLGGFCSGVFKGQQSMKVLFSLSERYNKIGVVCLWVVSG